MKYAVGLLILFSTLPAYPEAAALPKQTGWLDSADCSGISGWAWDAGLPSSRLAIDVYDGAAQGLPLATVIASNYRRDLQQVGIGDGGYGFWLPTPASLKDGRTHAIIATVSGTSNAIQIGTNTLNCPASATGYQYYFSAKLASLSADDWAVRGDASANDSGFTSPSPNGAALISRVAVPDGSSDYEVRASLNLKQSGGVYTIYLHGSPDALAGPAASGSYYAIDIQNPTFTDKGCTATLEISKRSSDSVTSLHSEAVACHDGMTVRAVAAADGHIGVWLDHWNLIALDDAEVAAGQPGVGVRSAPPANSIGVVDFGQLDRIAPGPLSPADVQVSASANQVELNWPRITDDPNGIGMGIYTVSRDGNVIAKVSRANPSFVDKNVQPGAVYTYEIAAYDMHLNRTSTFVTVATAEAATAVRR
ncbi:MAG TPA: fibronectin type III domain-containing protein [Bryobacteraceae bacterium]|nr:fibronectin type III domain-containing protein [Bryobacteraceae bacterium]